MAESEMQGKVESVLFLSSVLSFCFFSLHLFLSPALSVPYFCSAWSIFLSSIDRISVYLLLLILCSEFILYRDVTHFCLHSYPYSKISSNIRRLFDIDTNKSKMSSSEFPPPTFPLMVWISTRICRRACTMASSRSTRLGSCTTRTNLPARQSKKKILVQRHERNSPLRSSRPC